MPSLATRGSALFRDVANQDGAGDVIGADRATLQQPQCLCRATLVTSDAAPAGRAPRSEIV